MDKDFKNPSGKLASITRKKNELKSVLNEQLPDIKLVEVLFSEYRERVTVLESEVLSFLSNEEFCSAHPDSSFELDRWYKMHLQEDINIFQHEVENWLCTNKPATVEINNMHNRESMKGSGTKSDISEESKITSASRKLRKLNLEKAALKIHQEALHKKRQLEERLRISKIEQENLQRKLQESIEDIELETKVALLVEKEKSIADDERNSIVKSIKSKITYKTLNEEIDFQSDLQHKVKNDVLHPNPYLIKKQDAFQADWESYNERSLKNEKIKLDSFAPFNSGEAQNQMFSQQMMQQQTETFKMVARTHAKASLPKNEPKIFDGSDTTLYESFMQDFKSMIAEHCESESEKFHYLEKYTSGLALQLVRSCRSKNSNIGYPKALSALDENFGNEITIATEYIKQLNAWKPIKGEDGRALREFSIFLLSCDNMMEDYSTMNQLNSTAEMYKIIMKLPYKIRDKWRSYIHNMHQNRNRENFHDLVLFVKNQSSLLNMPMYENIADARPEKSIAKESRDLKKKVFATSVSKPKQEGNTEACLCCKKLNHKIYSCFFFKRKGQLEKEKFIKDHRLCFLCLSVGHMSSECSQDIRCKICESKHNTVMHSYNSRSKNEKKTESKNEESEKPIESLTLESPKTSFSVRTNGGNCDKTIYAAVPVKVKVQGSNKIISTYMGLDGYCSDIFMSADLLKEFGLKGIETEISLTTMTNQKNLTKTKVVNNVQILDLDENITDYFPVVYCHAPWPFNKEGSLQKSDVEKYPHLQDVPFKFLNKEIGLLVGPTRPDITMAIETLIPPEPSLPYATRHKYGWACQGPSTGENLPVGKKCFHVNLETKDEIDEQFKKLCAQDFVDLSPSQLEPSVDDIKWKEKVQNSYSKRTDGKYEVCLPFKEDNPVFPNNREQMFKRLMSSTRKLKTNIEYYNEYNSFINVMLENDFAEKVPSSELVTEPGNVWYLFHFGIYHKQKKKFRLVFDASLKYHGVSLNDALYQGPDMTNKLIGVLLRFRENIVAISADIQKMFYAVKVKDRHKDFLRFLWFPDGDLEKEPIEYRVTVHIFGAVSSPAVANFVLRESAYSPEARQFSEATRKTVKENFYVDDWLKSVESEEEASKLQRELTKMLSYSGFKLTEFVSNSRKVMNAIEALELAKQYKDLNLNLDPLPQEHALGVTWDVEDDKIGFKVNLPVKNHTKRGVLSTVASLYDPLGLASPVIVPAKLIFQQCCHLGLDWDDQLPVDLDEKWKNWLLNIESLAKYSIPRCVKPHEQVVNLQLHIFCDGSLQAIGVAGYLRSITNEGNIHCSLIMAKTRLVPIKGSAITTVPRIELNGAKLAVFLSQILKVELTLNIDKITYWTDSTTVLKYLESNTCRFKRFVANRVAYIREHSNVSDWRHVPTKQNPADLASRGVPDLNLYKCNIWKFGPSFLWESEEFWPRLNLEKSLDENDPEITKKKVILATQLEDSNPTETLLRSSSSWFKTKLRIAWMMQLKENLKTKSWNCKKVSSVEIQEAEIHIWKYVQHVAYSSIIKKLQHNQNILKKDPLCKLNPFLDASGLMRVGGRLERADISFEIKHPIILPSSHSTVQLLVGDQHLKIGHMGKETMIAGLRQKYWIVGLNSLARKIVRSCVICSRGQGRPSHQLMADLPQDRLQADIPVFSQIGIDAFGPFMVSRRRSLVKRYGLIITCLSSRAAHIEVLWSLETSSFINALTRFSSRRGVPSIIRSDNGTNFVGAERELKVSMHEWNQNVIEDFLKKNNINWLFQAPAASHFGGVWEREIRTIRKILGALTNVQPLHLDDEGLNTLFCQVESVLNSRPLTAISDDPGDLEAITPNHLLLLRSGISFPPGLFHKDDIYARRKWRQIQYLADVFWSRWRREYLPLLQERQKWTTDRIPHKVNDLVLLTDQHLPRNHWSLGRILKVYEDEKKRVRVADVKVSKVKGELKSRPVVLQRPIAKLILLPSSECN